MGQGIDTDTLDDLGTDDIVTDSDLAGRFRESLPEDQRAEFDRLYVPKAELTRMRQRDTENIRTMEERLARIEQGGVQKHPGDGVTDEIQGLLVKHGIEADGQSKAFHDMMIELTHATTQKAVDATIARLSPFINGVTQDVQTRQLSQVKQSLVNDLGKGVEKVWPEVEEAALRELRAGRPVDPELLLRRQHPEAYRRLVAASEERKRRQAQDRTRSGGMEGMVTHTRNTVFPKAGGRETNEPVFRGLDADQICADVRREMGL